MNRFNSKQILLFVFLVLFSIHNAFSQQNDSTSKVLLKEIAGSYKGDCKNGLANGKGTAIGEDTYKGMFQNGLPEGKGTYTYKNGNVFSGEWKHGLKDGKGKFAQYINGKATVITGYWKNGDYVGITKPADNYRITNLSSIENYSVKETPGDKNVIEISFEKVMKKYIPRDLEISISSGYKLDQNLKVLVLNYALPESISLHFTIPTSGGVRQCNFGVDILKAGKYEVFISNN